MEKRGVKTVEEVSKAAKTSAASPAAAISVVIPSYRRPSDLRRCLGALTLQTRAADEVVVVLHGDDAETVDVAGEFRDADGRRVVRWSADEDVESRRLRGEPPEAVLAELDALRTDMGDLGERVDFLERLLTRMREHGTLPPA